MSGRHGPRPLTRVPARGAFIMRAAFRQMGWVLLALPLGCGKPAASEPAEVPKVSPNAEPPKKKADELEAPWTERVTLRVWDEYTKRFLNPVADIKAHRREDKDGFRFFTSPAERPKIGSEIIDAAGEVYIVDRVDVGHSEHVSYVHRKPKT